MKFDRAVIVGAGFSGLIAARILSDHFQSVIVIDKDECVGLSRPRSGVPQGAHLHVLLKQGQNILRTLFPAEKLFDQGNCPIIDWAADTKWESMTGAFPRYNSDMKTYSFSRPFLEAGIHSLLAKRPNVSFIRSRVEGMIVESNIATHICGQDLGFTWGADLFVLAGGQNFPVNRFTDLIVDEPKFHIPIKIAYRSVVFETSSLRFDGFKQYYYQMTPPHDPIGAVICPIEGGRSIATIVEYGEPTALKVDLDGFMNIARKVPGGRFAHIIKDGRAFSDVSVFYKPSMYMRRPDQITGFPQNVFCIGDVFCSLNPVFGQGMTSVLIQGELLAEMLKTESMSSNIFHAVSASRLHMPFLLSKLGSDISASFSKRYLKTYLLRCQQSQKLHRKFLGALHLERPLSSLFDIPALVSALLCKMPVTKLEKK